MTNGFGGSNPAPVQPIVLSMGKALNSHLLVLIPLPVGVVVEGPFGAEWPPPSHCCGCTCSLAAPVWMNNGFDVKHFENLEKRKRNPNHYYLYFYWWQSNFEPLKFASKASGNVVWCYIFRLCRHLLVTLKTVDLTETRTLHPVLLVKISRPDNQLQ